MNKHVKHTFKTEGEDIVVETGRFAALAQGAVTLTMGGTTLFAAVTVDDKDTDLDYFPLSVEYLEKLYAAGFIAGSRFRKREGHPSDEAVIKAREVDHSIRSLFPKGFKRPVSVILTVLSYDGKNDPQSLTVLGASLAVMQSGVPFAGPCSSVVVGIKEDNSLVINPTADSREDFKGEFIVSGVDNQLLSLEGWGKEVEEDLMNDLIDKANQEIINLNTQQTKFIEESGKTLDIDPTIYPNLPAPEALISELKEKYYEEIKTAMFTEKMGSSRLAEVNEKVIEDYSESEQYDKNHLLAATDYLARKALREAILTEERRISGRKLDEIRPLSAEIDVLPTVHGSAIFKRGLTESLSIVTLGSKASQLLIDDMEGEDTKRFMHHYNFPPYSTGEAGRMRYFPGRREIGHGAIGENALMNMIADEQKFPYTIRAVSEIMSSNGSTSMAATCASSMALMAAGVPMKEAVAGIGVGLVTNDEDASDYKLLLDIEGVEDFYGDMDFKICGTVNGITAIQYENKLQGVPIPILKEGIQLARTGRIQVLEVMNSVISESRASVAKTAPKVIAKQIPVDRIGEFIGPSGKHIKELIESTKQFYHAPAEINIDDTGEVLITAVAQEQIDYVLERIENMFAEPEVGKDYDGVVDKVMNYGAFVNVSPSISGLCHVSEISDKFVKDASEILKEGQLVRVKILKIDETGRVNFTMKGVDQPEEK